MKRRDYEALRGRILLVFQESWREFLALRMMGETNRWLISVAYIARELHVSRQAVYRAVPELNSCTS